MPRPGRRPGARSALRTRVALWRVYRGMTQVELADAAGLSLSGYKKIERGRNRNPPIGALGNLAYVLGCEVTDLIDDEMVDWNDRPMRDLGPVTAVQPSDPRLLWRENRNVIRRANLKQLRKEPLPPAPPGERAPVSASDLIGWDLVQRGIDALAGGEPTLEAAYIELHRAELQRAGFPEFPEWAANDGPSQVVERETRAARGFDADRLIQAFELQFGWFIEGYRLLKPEIPD